MQVELPNKPGALAEYAAIAPDDTDDRAGINPMTQLIRSSTSNVHFLLPLPPGMSSSDSELFGFWTYELSPGICGGRREGFCGGMRIVKLKPLENQTMMITMPRWRYA